MISIKSPCNNCKLRLHFPCTGPCKKWYEWYQNALEKLMDYEFTEKEVIKAMKELQQYHEIGTVEECRKAVEKQTPKEVINRKVLKDFHDRPYCIQGDCPKCGCERIKSMNADYCYVCGQHLKWD